MVVPGTNTESFSRPVIRKIWLVSLFLFIVAGYTCGWFFSYLLNPAPVAEEARIIVTIPQGMSTRQIYRLFVENKLVHDDLRFLLLVNLMGDTARLQAGEFLLRTNQTPVQLIRELSTARPVAHKVTIPEGLRLEQIAERFARDGWVDRDRFLEAAHDPELIHELGLEEMDSLEGYLFPDTYHLARIGGDERTLIRMMVTRAGKIWDSFGDVDLHGLSKHQVYTLASIVEKESADNEEKPIIAGVFFNRLKKKMRLQSDPTVIYGIEHFDGKLKRSHLRKPTPYNTYTIPALPPGPICSPGKQSLQAVLWPATVDYFYFVSKNNGTHYFSRTLSEHNKAVRTYRKKKKKKK